MGGAGKTHEASLLLRDLYGNQCAPSDCEGCIVFALRSLSEPDKPYVTARTSAPPHVLNQRNGSYTIRWVVSSSGRYEFLLWLHEQLLSCSTQVDVPPAAASSRGSTLHCPADGVLRPRQWNVLPLTIRDDCGNPTDLEDRGRLELRCEGRLDKQHVRLREHAIADAEYEVLLYGARLGWITLEATLDGKHVRHSPAKLEVAAGGAVPVNCWAFGPGIDTPASAGSEVRFSI